MPSFDGRIKGVLFCVFKYLAMSRQHFDMVGVGGSNPLAPTKYKDLQRGKTRWKIAGKTAGKTIGILVSQQLSSRDPQDRAGSFFLAYALVVSGSA